MDASVLPESERMGIELEPGEQQMLADVTVSYSGPGSAGPFDGWSIRFIDPSGEEAATATSMCDAFEIASGDSAPCQASLVVPVGTTAGTLILQLGDFGSEEEFFFAVPEP
jgi:hypothetical protein